MEFVLFLVGGVIGCTATYILMRKKSHEVTVGTLVVDHSIPEEEPYLFLELNRGVGDITMRKHVKLDVRVENYISQD